MDIRGGGIEGAPGEGYFPGGLYYDVKSFPGVGWKGRKVVDEGGEEDGGTEDVGWDAVFVDRRGCLKGGGDKVVVIEGEEGNMEER